MKFENKTDTVLLIDDEPFQTEWLADYFQSKGLKVENGVDLQQALDKLERTRYRYVIIDLSIPASPALAQPLAELGAEFFRYPGLMAARRARTTGHNTFQTIVYSVHDSDDVETYTDKIRCRYILKGRPRDLKAHIDHTMARSIRGWHMNAKFAKPAKKVAKKPAKKGPAAKRTAKPSRPRK